MITRPLDLESRLSAPPRDMDVLFWVNVGAILLFFSLLGSRFVLAPGVAMQVDGMALPQSVAATQAAVSVVVNYQRDDMVVFESGIYELGDLRSRLEQYARERPGSVMLVRCDKAVSMQGFLKLCDLAREAGFARVLVAAEPQAAEESGLVTQPR